MDDHIIAIKGIKDGLLVHINPIEEWNTITVELAARIDERISFFAGAFVTADFGERPVTKSEMLSLKALLERRNLTLNVVLSASRTTLDSAEALDIRTTSGNMIAGRDTEYESARDGGPEDVPFDPEEEGTIGKLVRRTLRSGRTIHSHGHVVVYGDVNPGAEIVATGDIIVWGRLRGRVHAGAEGDESAIICALDMAPGQLRIAGYIATSPDDKNHQAQPEVAFIRNHQLVVEAWR